MPKIERMPVNEVRAVLLQILIASRDGGNMELVPLAISMTEYLKDAERWQYVKNNDFLDGLMETPDQFQDWVDAQLARAGNSPG